MFDKMYKAMDKATEAGEKVTGVKVNFPRHTKRSLKVSALTNTIVGTGLAVYGLASSTKWPIIAGAIGIASGATLNKVSKSTK